MLDTTMVSAGNVVLESGKVEVSVAAEAVVVGLTRLAVVVGKVEATAVEIPSWVSVMVEDGVSTEVEVARNRLVYSEFDVEMTSLEIGEILVWVMTWPAEVSTSVSVVL